MIKDIIEDLCQLEAHLARLSARRAELRELLLTAALDELEETGAAPTWRTEVGTVGLTIPKATPVVVDEDAFATFVAQQWGDDQIETIRRVRPANAKAIFRVCSEALSSAALITRDGERVPGVVLRSKFPYLAVRLDPAAKMTAMDNATEQVS